jgi:hypothetical protein
LLFLEILSSGLRVWRGGRYLQSYEPFLNGDRTQAGQPESNRYQFVPAAHSFGCGRRPCRSANVCPERAQEMRNVSPELYSDAVPSASCVPCPCAAPEIEPNLGLALLRGSSRVIKWHAQAEGKHHLIKCRPYRHAEPVSAPSPKPGEEESLKRTFLAAPEVDRVFAAAAAVDGRAQINPSQE